jgi:hypothetical protein
VKGAQPFYRKGVSSQYQNLGVIQKDAIHYVTYVIHYVAYVMHNVSPHYANSKKYILSDNLLSDDSNYIKNGTQIELFYTCVHFFSWHFYS